MAIKDWTKEEILEVYNTPLMELMYKAAEVHKQNHTVGEVQVSSLLSIKTGGCPEDCSYCPQAARYHTEVKVHKLMSVPEVDEAANNAKAGGASRMCLGAAWREVRDNRDFDTVLDMVKIINSKGLEVCATLGMVTEDQAKRLAEAGLYAYNHNIDTSEENYENIISTRTFDDRINTIKNVRKAGLTVCSGGIIGMGEKIEDRVGMLYTLSLLRPQPESVPINALVAVEGTPMADQPPVPIWDMVRMIATARIVLPRTAVRLSAGRLSMSMEGQALCFMAGANSIFAGEILLTTANPLYTQDMEMFKILGLSNKQAFVDKLKKEEVAQPAGI
ncbi:MAG: biotin synthase BioB [Burkholderiales bacterium]|nr:biotin synthase BioB [Bacteroidia bacterium]